MCVYPNASPAPFHHFLGRLLLNDNLTLRQLKGKPPVASDPFNGARASRKRSG